jgi:hypothetical protein
MTEPLSVDPSRLGEIGQVLADLVFPTAPAPMTVPGSDPVSSAINATMPNLESLVSDGLPGVKAALTRTASNMSTAAAIYTKSDQSLGDSLRQAVFGVGGQGLAGVASNVQGQFSSLMGSSPDQVGPGLSSALDAVAPGLGEKVAETVTALSPRVEATVPQLVQLAPQAGQMAAQSAPMLLSTMTSMAGQGGSGGAQGAAAPAELASDTKKDDDDKDDQSDGDGDGATAGTKGAGSTPTHLVGTDGKSPPSPTVRTV